METRSNHVLVGGIVLALIAAMLGFTVWLSSLSGTNDNRYDIFFTQAVDGLAKGSPVAFQGVPVGQIEQIALEPNRPDRVRVRIAIDANTPVLQGTTATIQSIGFTGVSQVQLDGAVRGRPAISAEGPYGVPVIPAKPGGFAALLSSAPELLDRVSTLTERLAVTLNDRNQESLAGILENFEDISRSLAARSPEIAATLVETRAAVRESALAAQRIGELAQSTQRARAKRWPRADQRRARRGRQPEADHRNRGEQRSQPRRGNFRRTARPAGLVQADDPRSGFARRRPSRHRVGAQ